MHDARNRYRQNLQIPPIKPLPVEMISDLLGQSLEYPEQVKIVQPKNSVLEGYRLLARFDLGDESALTEMQKIHPTRPQAHLAAWRT